MEIPIARGLAPMLRRRRRRTRRRGWWWKRRRTRRSRAVIFILLCLPPVIWNKWLVSRKRGRVQTGPGPTRSSAGQTAEHIISSVTGDSTAKDFTADCFCCFLFYREDSWPEHRGWGTYGKMWCVWRSHGRLLFAFHLHTWPDPTISAGAITLHHTVKCNHATHSSVLLYSINMFHN